ncbi:MAG: dihydroorotate dehydrogenase [Actinobacteria bacterium]|nr:dihydroorotate dehydrogenase [Actinomycetota bacterium]
MNDAHDATVGSGANAPSRTPHGLATRLGPIELSHPIINASGTLDLFEVAATLADVDEAAAAAFLADPPVAAYVPKTVTPHPRPGNPPPRILETAGGMLNSIGLPNGGIEAFVTRELPRLLSLPCPVILNVGGFARDDYVEVAAVLRVALEEALGEAHEEALGEAHEAVVVGASWLSRVGLELNVSCPNVHTGCMSIGSDRDETAAVVAAVREEWPGLLLVKLTPNVTHVVPIARAAAEAGADGLSLVNTFKGLALDRVSLKPYLGGVTGGLSGPAIKPLALRIVYEVRAAVDIPLVGMGGVGSVQDVLEFLACGASVVAVGASGFRDPWKPRTLAVELEAALEARSMALAEVIGMAHE